jgi:hypothetical protein
MYVWFTPTKLHDHTMKLYNHTMFVWFTPSKIYLRERVLLIGTQFSNLYTAVDTPARGRTQKWVCSYLPGLFDHVNCFHITKILFSP